MRMDDTVYNEVRGGESDEAIKQVGGMSAGLNNSIEMRKVPSNSGVIRGGLLYPLSPQSQRRNLLTEAYLQGGKLTEDQIREMDMFRGRATSVSQTCPDWIKAKILDVEKRFFTAV